MQTLRSRGSSATPHAVLFPALVALASVACSTAVDVQTSSGTPAGGTASSAQNGAGGGAGTGGTGGAQTGAGGQAGAGGGSSGCTGNADCTNDPNGNVCDTMTGECVGCLPSNDQCPSGQYCNPTTEQCEVGCTDDTDCNATQVCDTQTNNCVGCNIDTDCPAGSICVSNTCVDGCSGTQPCQLGSSCCSSVCYDLATDENNCGTCDNTCPMLANAERYCDQGVCVLGPCDTAYADCNVVQSDGCEHNVLQDGPCLCVPGQTMSCYQGAPGTDGVGACMAGTQMCNADGLGWGLCTGQVLPAPDVCANGIDEDCDGTVDNGSDLDGDGWSECNGDCCDVVGPGCMSPGTVNPGAFEFVGNMLDDDCDPSTSDTAAAPPCSTSSKFDLVTADDVARAIELCQFTQPNPPIEQKKWGVITAEQRLANGNPPSAAQLANMQNWQTAILQDYGVNVFPKVGSTMAAISSGRMRDQSDPDFVNPNGGTAFGSASQPPPDYLAANGGMLPASQGCSGSCPAGSGANDSVNIRLTIRVPTNALSFSYKFKFNSAEYWTYSCTAYNDFFLALLQTTAPGIPADENISFDSLGNPVSVNNGFFEVCVAKGCYACPAGTSELQGTGLEVGNTGGATKWLTTDAPVTPGEDMMLELMIFDVSDGVLDSLVLLDAFKWNPVPAEVGTHE